MRPARDILAAFDAFPETGLGFLNGARPLILAPHPDDESLGCGGLIAASCREDRPPLVALLTDGAASHPGSKRYPPDRLRALRAAELRAASHRLGLKPQDLVLLNYPDTALPASGPGLDAAAAKIAALARRHGCGVIIAPWRHDPHCDHEAAALIAAAAAGKAGCRLLSYPVWGWLLPPETMVPVCEPRGWRLDISAHRAAKQRAIAAHLSQYGGLIDDSPTGFTLPRALLSVFERDFEVFIES